MTLNDFLNMLRKNLVFIVFLILISAGVAFYSTGFLKSGFREEKLLFLTLDDTQTSKDIRLDPTNSTDTAIALLNSGLKVVQPKMSIDAKKVAPQVIKLSVESQDPGLAEQTATSLVETFNSQAKNLMPGHNITLTQIDQNQAPARQLLNSKVMAAFGALVGFVLAIMAIILARYFKI